MQGWGTEPGKPEAEGLQHSRGKQSRAEHLWPPLSPQEQPLPSLPPSPPGRVATEPVLSQPPAARCFPAGRGQSAEEPVLSNRPALRCSAADRPGLQVGFRCLAPALLGEKEVARCLPPLLNGSCFGATLLAQPAPLRAIAPLLPFLPFSE